MSTSDPRPPSERNPQRDELLEVLNSLRSTMVAMAEVVGRQNVPSRTIVWNDEIDDLSHMVYPGGYIVMMLPGPTGGCRLQVAVMSNGLELTLDTPTLSRIWQRRLFWRR